MLSVDRKREKRVRKRRGEIEGIQIFGAHLRTQGKKGVVGSAVWSRECISI